MGKHSLLRFIAGCWLGASSLAGQAACEFNQETSEGQRADAAIARLDQEGYKLPGPGYEKLHSEAQVIGRVMHTFRSCRHPLQIESADLKKRVEDHNLEAAQVSRWAADLQARVSACERNPANCDVAAINQEVAEYNIRSAEINARKERLDREQAELDRRIEQENSRHIASYVAFSQRVEAAFADYARRLGHRPVFASAWQKHLDPKVGSRVTAGGLIPNDNRCALTLSITLGLSPRPGEHSLDDMPPNTPWKRHLIDEIRGAGLAGRYYIKSAELASRLRNEWGEPIRPRSRNIDLHGKVGVLFFDGGFGGGNHIDLWNGQRWAADTRTNFEQAMSSARDVWFWELR